MKERMLEGMARVICQTANDPHNVQCPHCFGDEGICMWKQFMNEAEAALEVVKKYAIVQIRDKKKKR